MEYAFRVGSRKDWLPRLKGYEMETSLSDAIKSCLYLWGAPQDMTASISPAAHITPSPAGGNRAMYVLGYPDLPKAAAVIEILQRPHAGMKDGKRFLYDVVFSIGSNEKGNVEDMVRRLESEGLNTAEAPAGFYREAAGFKRDKP